jgi:hypothetical protein
MCECVALAELRFYLLGKHVVEASDYDEIQLCKMLYFICGMGLLAERSRWECTIDQKLVAVQGSPYAPTSLILLHLFNKAISFVSYIIECAASVD